MLEKEKVMAVGFDLDGTLFRSTPEMNDLVRNEMSRYILMKKPQLETIVNARKHFEERYKELQSGSKILKEVGYDNAHKITDQCIATADICHLIDPDSSLVDLLNNIRKRFFTYLITASPKEMALKKLGRLGIVPYVFNERVYNDTPGGSSKQDGSAFRYLLAQTNIPAENHVYIGDRARADILPPKSLGMQTIGVWSEIPEADLSIENIYCLRDVLL